MSCRNPITVVFWLFKPLHFIKLELTFCPLGGPHTCRCGSKPQCLGLPPVALLAPGRNPSPGLQAGGAVFAASLRVGAVEPSQLLCSTPTALIHWLPLDWSSRLLIVAHGRGGGGGGGGGGGRSQDLGGGATPGRPLPLPKTLA